MGMPSTSSPELGIPGSSRPELGILSSSRPELSPRNWVAKPPAAAVSAPPPAAVAASPAVLFISVDKPEKVSKLINNGGYSIREYNQVVADGYCESDPCQLVFVSRSMQAAAKDVPAAAAATIMPTASSSPVNVTRLPSKPVSRHVNAEDIRFGGALMDGYVPSRAVNTACSAAWVDMISKPACSTTSWLGM